MQWNMQREVTVSKFRPGLNRKKKKDFNFIQCIAFSRHLGYAVGYFYCHQKGLKPEKWNKMKKNKTKKKKRSELKDHWHDFQHVNVTINDVHMSCLQGQYQCFWCLLSVSVSSAGTGKQIQLSSPLKCCPRYFFNFFFCTVFRQKEKGDVVFSRYRLNNVWQKWHLRVRTASCQWFLLYLYYLSYKRKHHEPVTGNKLYEKSRRRERIVRNRKDAHDKNTGIALKYSHKVNEIVSSEDWRVGLFMFNFFFFFAKTDWNQPGLQLQMNKNKYFNHIQTFTCVLCDHLEKKKKPWNVLCKMQRTILNINSSLIILLLFSNFE